MVQHKNYTGGGGGILLSVDGTVCLDCCVGGPET